MSAPTRWNHNTHYHALLLAAVPGGCSDALDVGCGEGGLARELCAIVPRVVGIDPDPRSIELARAQDPTGSVEYVLGDVLSHPFAPASFDLVTAVATLHHLPARQALRRLTALLRPGGTLAIIGLGRRRLPRDLPWELAGAVTTRVHARRRGYWEHPSPVVWPPPESFAAMRRLAAQELPGARFRRHVLWRYSLLWVKPG